MSGNVFDRTMNDSSTAWASVTGLFGAFTFNEWCLLITAIVTILNFVKNYYIDMKKLKWEEEEHELKLKQHKGEKKDE